MPKSDILKCEFVGQITGYRTDKLGDGWQVTVFIPKTGIDRQNRSSLDDLLQKNVQVAIVPMPEEDWKD